MRPLNQGDRISPLRPAIALPRPSALISLLLDCEKWALRDRLITRIRTQG
ncbi:hypothetical protein [Leptodesmis sichuanensis]|nr:hypothetical protein [Leptodesmis sichuanensis]UIE38104.1 hypothetical protein KIK02_00105 [Leptodesmis sichuanensis A121]